MKFYFFLILSLVAITEIVAQSILEPGYIITKEKDTLHGFILEKTDAELAEKVLFKPDKNSVLKTYKSNELLGFGFDQGRVFEQIPIKISAEDTSFVFVKRVVEGKIDLLVRRYPHQNNPDIFLSGNNQTLAFPNFQKRRFKGRDSTRYSRSEFVQELNLFKVDSSFIQSILSLKKFSERRIRKEVIKYNRKFQDRNPVKIYREEVRYNYDVLVGMPVNSSEELHFRVGVYCHKSRIERTTNFSFMQGLVYHHLSNKVPSLLADENSSYRWQFLNVIPLGVNFHGNTKLVQPYGYAGLGFGVIMDETTGINKVEQRETEPNFQFLPTLNIGIGLKLRLGKTSLITELTPTINSLFWNVGISL